MKKWQVDVVNLVQWLTTEEAVGCGLEITRDLWELQGERFATIYKREPALMALARMPAGNVQNLNPYLLWSTKYFWEVKLLLPDAPRLHLVFGQPQPSGARLAWGLRVDDCAAPLTLASGERNPQAWAQLQAWLRSDATGQAAEKMMSLLLDAQPSPLLQTPMQAAQLALWVTP